MHADIYFSDLVTKLLNSTECSYVQSCAKQNSYCEAEPNLLLEYYNYSCIQKVTEAFVGSLLILYITLL